MKTLRAYLDSIVAWHKSNDWGGGTPVGLSQTAIRDAVATSGFKLVLPDNLMTVYEWSNGYGDIIPKYSLHDLETALRCGVYLRGVRSKQDSEITGLLPILNDINDDFGGSYCVQCFSRPSADGAVFYVDHEEEGGRTKLAYEGVYNMFRTFSLAMKKGAIIREDDGLRVKPKLFKQIRQKCNPNIGLVRKRQTEEME